MSRFVNAILVLLIAIAAVLLISSRREGAVLKAEHDRLASQFGSLEVVDEDKFLVCHVENTQKDRFLWRVYQPPLSNGLESRIGSLDGWSSHGGADSKSRQYRVFARYRVSNGQPQVFVSIGGQGSSVMQLDSGFKDLFVEHWNDLNFEILAEESPMEIPADKAVTLLRVTLPESMTKHPSLEKMSDRRKKELLQRPVLEIQLGDQAVVK